MLVRATPFRRAKMITDLARIAASMLASCFPLHMASALGIAGDLTVTGRSDDSGSIATLCDGRDVVGVMGIDAFWRLGKGIILAVCRVMAQVLSARILRPGVKTKMEIEKVRS